MAVAFDADEAVLLEATQRHGHGWGRDFQPVGQTRGDDFLAFTLGFEN